MATRSLVLVVFHAWRHVGSALLSVLVALVALLASPAHAGSNTWTATGPYANASCNGASWATVASCGEAWVRANVACGYMGAGYTSSYRDTSDATSEHNWVTGAYCTLVPGNLGGVYQFTNNCASAGRSFNGTHGVCAEPCSVGTTDPLTGDCIPPPDCSSFAGRQVDRFYADMGIGGAICATPPGEEVMGCEALVAAPTGFAACAGGECFARVEFTGNQCGAEPDETGEVLADEPGTTNCVSGGGVTVCAAQSSQNCGTVNGQSVCLDTIPPGRCTFLGNGGMVCASDATAPPAPTDSGGMDAAMPDGAFTAAGNEAEEQEYNYFGPGTVASSGTSTSGSGQSGTNEPAEEGDEPCMEVGSCPGAVPELGDATSFADATSAFMAGVESAPLVAAAAGLGASLPAGECPAPSTTLEYIGGLELTLDAHCGLWDEIATVLSAVMLAVWVFVGARILLSA